MNCPNCSQLLNNDSRICPHCATEFSLSDWTALQQYDFLINQTSDWQPYNWQSRRREIVNRYNSLRTKWQSADAAAPSPIADTLETSEQKPTTPAVEPSPSLHVSPSPHPVPKQSFDQWLFSENTIKTALYSGALLLILAGLIFVGANWARIPWQGKFGVTLAVTAATCVLGFGLLLRSKTLRIGGIALIAISAGFAPLNPYVLYEYWLDGLGVAPELVWLIGSILCLGFYIWLARRTESPLFGLFSALATVTTIGSLYAVLNAEGNYIAPLIMLIPVALLLAATLFRASRYLALPLTIVGHIMTLPLMLFFWVVWSDERGDTAVSWTDSAWFFVMALWLGALFYWLNSRAVRSGASRWAFTAALALASASTVVHLGFSPLVTALLLVLLAGLFLVASTRIETLTAPLFVFTFVIAVVATLYAANGSQMDVVWVLLADVVLLLVVTLIRRHVVWYTAAIWFAVAPVVVYASIWADDDYQMALMLAGLMVLYVGAAAVVRIGRIGFYSAAVALSLTLLPLAIDNLPTASTLAFVTAALYLWSAWRERDFLLPLKRVPFTALPALAAIAFIFIGHYFVLGQFDSDTDGASVVTVLLCTAFVAAALLLRTRQGANRLYGQPLNFAGLVLLVVPLFFAIDEANWVLPVVAAIASATLLVDGWLRSRLYQCYVGVGVAWIALAALLDLQNVRQVQAYAIPAGLALLAIGWNEQRHDRTSFYVLFSLAGLLVLFGSAFVQSLDESRYAFLLLVESVLAVGWGVRQRSRGFVQLGVLALLANGVAQFGPAFAELPRFVQFGSIGSILLVAGLLALFRREKLLATQDAWRAEWARWNP